MILVVRKAILRQMEIVATKRIQAANRIQAVEAADVITVATSKRPSSRSELGLEMTAAMMTVIQANGAAKVVKASTAVEVIPFMVQIVKDWLRPKP